MENLIKIGSPSRSFKYFYQRFENGRCIKPSAPKITTEESAHQFKPRKNGLKVLLINPPIREWSYPNIIPIGQAYIASVAIMDGHKVEVLDLNQDRREPVADMESFNKWVMNTITKKLQKTKPDVIGIGGIITQYSRIQKILNLCQQQFPQAIRVMGGGVASCLPEFMMKTLNVDIVATEECEITFSEILHKIETDQDMNGVEGTWFKTDEGKIISNGKRPTVVNGEDGLDQLPWPARFLYDIEGVYKQNPIGHLNWVSKWEGGKPQEQGKYSLSLLGSRGCPYSCDYCYVTYLGEKYRIRSPEDIVDEMEYLVKRYDLCYLHFLDDLFLTKWKWSFEFFEELQNRKKTTGFNIEWGSTCRTNIIADDVIRAKKQNRTHMIEEGFKAGMRQVCLGIETASPTILKNIDKSGQTPEKIRIAAEEIKRVMGYLDPSFMVGSPGETKETIKETVDFCKKHNIDVETIFYTTAFPGTPFWQLALDKGLIGKAVTGKKCDADDSIIEEYFKRLGENSEEVRTNFSDELSDDQLIELGVWATDELGSKNRRHPHTGEIQLKPTGAAKADI
jgi:anaerobic magnesium-protoporphyrin IX monomethyl ester cyclase